ncbi:MULTISPECIES: hypothetical protein [unclassified Streptomyces]|uniref:Uncharacterized protein n=1 Tax=Streptomyces sp. NBC_00119 TaxID=2975659 RepID=A0AAU1UJ73_9ACTN|nr:MULTISPECIES: hypothetical protein [unclassified Streptomyces]MCX4650210.1 hypothetical protein [Streptomyces sp. NBC_01446]MCX5320570.1 hypothetical protein [Streptomyces sp. NBC_00120]
MYGRDEDHIPEAVPLTAGLGHILPTVGLILLCVLLGKRVNEHVKQQPETNSQQAEAASV